MAAHRGGGAADEVAQPQDVGSIHQLLRSMGVDEFEPRVVNQLMDYMYKYTAGVLTDAEAYSEHFGRSAGHVDKRSVEVAIQSQTASYTQPPPQEQAAQLAKLYNEVPLPEAVVKPGLPLPAEGKLLAAPNWQYDPYQQYQQR